jgi:hypothetical protein
MPSRGASVRKALSLLFIMMLAVRSLLPAGFMLQAAASGDGSIEIVICTGHGAQKITLDADGKPVAPKPAKSDAGLCPYAASAPVAVAAAEPVPAALSEQIAVVAYAVPAPLRGHERPPGAASARGPPNFQS